MAGPRKEGGGAACARMYGGVHVRSHKQNREGNNLGGGVQGKGLSQQKALVGTRSRVGWFLAGWLVGRWAGWGASRSW